MSITAYQDYVTYLGAGNLDTYEFPYKITNANQILIIVFDDSGVLDFSETGDELVNVTSVTFDANSGGGEIVLAVDLPADYRLFIKLAEDTPTQDFIFRDQRNFKLKEFENALDYLAMVSQRQVETSKRLLGFNDEFSYTQGAVNLRITTQPLAYGIPIMNVDGTQLRMISLQDALIEVGIYILITAAQAAADASQAAVDALEVTVADHETRIDALELNNTTSFSSATATLDGTETIDYTDLFETAAKAHLTLSSTGGEIVSTASPQITFGGVPEGRELFIRGGSDTNYIVLVSDANTDLNGDCYLTADQMLHLILIGTTWIEVKRRI